MFIWKKTMIDDMYGEHSIVFGRECLIEYACKRTV